MIGSGESATFTTLVVSERPTFSMFQNFFRRCAPRVQQVLAIPIVPQRQSSSRTLWLKKCCRSPLESARRARLFEGEASATSASRAAEPRPSSRVPSALPSSACHFGWRHPLVEGSPADGSLSRAGDDCGGVVVKRSAASTNEVGRRPSRVRSDMPHAPRKRGW